MGLLLFRFNLGNLFLHLHHFILHTLHILF